MVLEQLRNPEASEASFCAKSDSRTKDAPSLRTIGAFLTVREVAERLSVSPATVYALERSRRSA